MKYAEQYRQDLLTLHHHRVYYIILVGMVMMLVFSILDYKVASEYFAEFSLYRLAACGFGVLLLLLNYRDTKKEKALFIGFFGYICVGIFILIMILRMGGIASPYYVGLIVTMTIYTAIAPLTVVQTLLAGFSLVGIYCVAMLVFTSILADQLIDFFGNLFFLICFVFIAATQSWADTTARRREFLLRMQQNELADELTHHADILEVEVEKRTEEHKVSEKRYRLLFNRIADAVVLVNRQGDVLQCNASFQRYYSEKSNEKRSFFNSVREKDREEVKNNLLDVVAGGEPVSAFQISLLSKGITTIDTEISGTMLQREGKSIGVQLVIRDITTREYLKTRLVESLKEVRKTESATILALAKLSESRDLTPGNHLERIREYCRIIGRELSLKSELRGAITPAFLYDLYHASILYDIGKVSIPDTILNKSTPLTSQEEEVVHHHTLVGGDVIRSMEEGSQEGGFLSMAKVIAYFHHEQWDGKGYPHGLKEREIPLAARIMAVVDAYEEMTATGSEEHVLSHSEAAKRIMEGSGHQFDPMIVEAFAASLDEFDLMRQEFIQ